MKAAILNAYLSQPRLGRLRAKAERKRVKSGAPHEVLYFHDPADPYSDLTAQILPELQARYDIKLSSYLCGLPDAGAAPEPEKLAAYALKDANVLGAHYGLKLGPLDFQPEHQNGSELRAKLGHYLGATFYYAGEWYWGLDRLHYLETRLTGLGIKKPKGPKGHICPLPIIETPEIPPMGKAKTVEFYLSLRSPYTYLAAMQVFDLARAYGAEIVLKPVLPMVMRGLPVPKSKRLYIVKDVKRQALRLGLPFGRIADPVGKPVERGMAVLEYAVSQGKGEAFIVSFLEAAWAEGKPFLKPQNFKTIVERAGLNLGDAQAALKRESWKTRAATNRQELLDLGLWGVPSFKVGGTAIWGEDRLWHVAKVLSEV